jgi:hypothetical protein
VARMRGGHLMSGNESQGVGSVDTAQLSQNTG